MDDTKGLSYFLLGLGIGVAVGHGVRACIGRGNSRRASVAGLSKAAIICAVAVKISARRPWI